jgi:hypothetical protein
MAGKKLSGKFKAIIAGVLSVVLLAGVGAGGYAIGRHVNNKKENDEAAVGGMVMTDVENSGGIKLMSKVIGTGDYSKYNIPTGTESAQLVSATVEPANATIKTFDWFIKFADDFVLNSYLEQEGYTADGNSADGTSFYDTYKASDSITLVQQDNKTDVLVLCNNGFAQQINLFARANGDNDSEAHIAMDYISDVTGVTVSDTNGAAKTVLSTFGYDSEYEAIASTPTITGYTYDIGTLQPETLSTATIIFVADGQNIGASTDVEKTFGDKESITLYSVDDVVTAENRETAFDYINGCDNKTCLVGTVKVDVTLYYSGYTSHTTNCRVNLGWYVQAVGDKPIPVTSITINGGESLVFYK